MLRFYYFSLSIALLFIISSCSKEDDKDNQDPGRFRNHLSTTIISPPAELNLNSYYTKYINSTGIPIISPASIDDVALYRADSIAEFMLTGLENVRKEMIKLSTYYAIMPDGTGISDVPELAYLEDDSLTGIRSGCFHPRDGLGVSYESNILCKAWPVNQNDGEDVFVHEFAHAMHLNGLFYFTNGFEERLKRIYNDAMSKGIWDNTYAATNHIEYFAEGIQTWFEVNIDWGPPGGDGVHNDINTRAKLLQRDPDLHNLITQYFQSGFDVPGCN